MDKLLTLLIVLGVGLIVFLIDRTCKYTKEHSVYKLVSQVMEYHNHNRIPQYNAILKAQHDLQIPKEYHVSIEDHFILEEIIAEFKKSLSEAYFKGQVGYIRSKYVIEEDAYFMYKLCGFLADHRCDREVGNHNMRKAVLSYKSHGSWGSDLYDASYKLSDFGLIYHKVYYISYLFCKNSKIFNPKGNSFPYENSIKEVIDQEVLSVSQT